MPIPVKTYKHQVAPASVQIGNTPQQNASLNVANTPESMMTQGLLKAGGSLAESYLKKQQKLQEAQQAADIIDETTKYYDSTRKYEQDYQNQFKKNDAREALQEWDAFHAKEMQQRETRFKDNPQLNLLWKRSAGQIRQGSLNRASEYALSEDVKYREDVAESRVTTYIQKVGENAMNDRVVEHLRKQLNSELAALNIGDLTPIMAQADLDTATTRIRTALANDDPDTARKLMNAYKGVLGKSFDEVEKNVSTAEDSKRAFEISEEVRLTMPEASLGEKEQKISELAAGKAAVQKAATIQVARTHSHAERTAKEQQNMIIDMFQAKIVDADTPQKRQAVIVEINSTPMETASRTKLLKQASTGIKAPMVSDDKKLREVTELAVSGEITAQELERNYFQYLSADDMKLQKKMITQKGGARVNRFLLQMAQQADTLFPKDTSGGKTQKRKAKLLMDEMKQYVQEYEADKGGMPSDKELSEHRSWLLEKVIYNESWYGDKEAERMMIEGMEAEKLDIPDDMRRWLIKQLKDNGLPVNDEEILRAYKAKMREKE